MPAQPIIAANISKPLMRSAEARGLEWIGTGGGCDYVCRSLNGDEPAPIMILGTPDDAGSPEVLDEPATVTLYLHEDWTAHYIVFRFETAADGMDFMQGFETADVAALWK
jgi:hypothetical protein